VLSAGRDWAFRALTSCLVRASPVVAPASKCDVRCLSFVGHRIVRIGGTGDMPVEALFPEGRERFGLAYSGWSRVLGIDAVGGSPHCDFADEGPARVASRRCPGWLVSTSVGVILDLVREVGNQLRSLCQVASPDGIGLEGCWDAREPGQRTWVGWRERCEAPVEDGRHIVCSSEVASAGGCQQVAEWVFPCFGR
jgi:hypothetical protein